MFTKEVRLQAALEGALPEYIQKLVMNCLETGNAYGKTEISEELAAKIAEHAKKTDVLLVLGADARYIAPCQAVKAIKVLEKAGVEFTVAADEKATGAQLDFLIGAANEAKAQMTEAAKVYNEYATVVVYDPADAMVIKRIYGEYGIELTAKVSTYTAFLDELLKAGKLAAENKGKTVVFQDPFQLARDLEETEEARNVIMSFADLTEMLLNRGETVWAGNVLMAQYIPEVMKKVAERRLYNVTSIGQSVIVTASVSEYVSLKNVEQNEVEILSIEDLILA
jgi:Fe-S oxidoreductase